MSATTAAGLLLLVLPVVFNVAFGLLAAHFDYPDILRRPAPEVLARFRAGGTGLVLTWWVFAGSALLLAPAAVLLAAATRDADPTLLDLGVLAGVLAALVQLLGLIRWPFAVPELARISGDPDASAARREAAEVTFDALNRLLGVGVGEHLGYGLTGAWSALAGAAILGSEALPDALGWVGIALAPLFALGALEFVGPNEPRGWAPAARLVPVTYVVWSLWLAALGIGLLV